MGLISSEEDTGVDDRDVDVDVDWGAAGSSEAGGSGALTGA